jgi:ABC-type branched-subunit amino acid transport system substrate-binding protein
LARAWPPAKALPGPTIRIGMLQDHAGPYSDLGGAIAEVCARQAAAVVQAAGGRVLGEVAVPLGTPDFSSALLAAQASGAKVVALGMAGTDLLNCVKQAAEFGLSRGGQKVVALIVFINDIKSLGLASAQGTLACATFYWNLNDRSRAFTKRVIGETGGVPPNMSQAGSYSAVRHYLKTVASMGAAEAKRSGLDTVARMKAIPVEDDVLADAHIRADGRVVSDAYVFEVKSVAEHKPLGPLHAADHAGARSGVALDGGWRLPAGQELIRDRDKAREVRQRRQWRAEGHSQRNRR